MHGESDAWSYTLDAVRRFFDHVATKGKNSTPSESLLPRKGLVSLAQAGIAPEIWVMCNSYLESAALLGKRTAQLHLALGSAPDRPEFAPEPFSELYQRSLYQEMRGLTRRTFRMLRSRFNGLAREDQPDVAMLLTLEQELLDRFRGVMARKLGGARIRCHGDYHLGQVFYTGKDFVIIDFEGEPMRHLSQRRIKRSPLRDVAGMIRSFDYASQSVLMNYFGGILQKEEAATFRKWADVWSVWNSVAFLEEYLDTLRGSSLLPQSAAEVQMLIDAFLLEKAVYEVGYELNNRPTWLRVPVQGILRILAPREATP